MPIDWSNIDPASVPKYDTTVENRETSVLPDRETVIGIKPIPVGPGKVFPEGYPTMKTVRSTEDNKYSFDGKTFVISQIWDGDKWSGFQVSSEYGDSVFRGVSIVLEPEVLIRRHMNEKTGKTFMTEQDVRDKAIKLQMTTDTTLLRTHNIADPSEIRSVLYPEGQSLQDSLANENAFIVTNAFKIIDVATHQWPINIDKAVDVRAQLCMPVKFNDSLGTVASCMEDDIVLVQNSSKPFTAAIEDLEPIMLPKEYRLALIGGITQHG